jgi:hypothetical protein
MIAATMTRAAGLVSACAMAVSGLAGCGSIDPPADAPTAVRAFLHAAAARDGPRACSLLTKQGQLEMAAYARRYGESPRASRDCVETVNQLDRLPLARDWRLLERGRIDVNQATEQDNQPVTVTYSRDGWQRSAWGFVQPTLTGGFQVSSPPFPVRLRPSRRGSREGRPAVGRT